MWEVSKVCLSSVEAFDLCCMYTVQLRGLELVLPPHENRIIFASLERRDPGLLMSALSAYWSVNQTHGIKPTSLVIYIAKDDRWIPLFFTSNEVKARRIF